MSPVKVLWQVEIHTCITSSVVGALPTAHCPGREHLTAISLSHIAEANFPEPSLLSDVECSNRIHGLVSAILRPTAHHCNLTWLSTIGQPLVEPKISPPESHVLPITTKMAQQIFGQLLSICNGICIFLWICVCLRVCIFVVICLSIPSVFCQWKWCVANNQPQIGGWNMLVAQS